MRLTLLSSSDPLLFVHFAISHEGVSCSHQKSTTLRANPSTLNILRGPYCVGTDPEGGVQQRTLFKDRLLLIEWQVGD